MSFQQTKAYSILHNKCPSCHKGNFFAKNNPYNLKYFAQMNPYCPNCGEDFRRETGYYFGATYISYGLTVVFGVLLYILLSGVFNIDTIPFLLIFSSLLIIMMPLFYRFARIIWINMFVNYKP